MEVYLKPKKKAKIKKGQPLAIKDVAEVFAENHLKQVIESIKLPISTKGIELAKDDVHIVSVLDIIEAITKQVPNAVVSNVGESDTLVVFTSPAKKPSKTFSFLKVLFVCLVLFVGSTTAIMTFHTDSQMGEVFKQYHKMFFDEEVEKPLLINISYSIGLAVGIMVFFNHFGRKRITSDPTPIEVEMETYEKDTADALIQHISRKEDEESKS
ncbi:MAG: stage V sporulation protein AA [Defluviitaleaceae bacterium]|nr:stage V sporulation protein AA [Defluviitaleaceae bacterium]